VDNVSIPDGFIYFGQHPELKANVVDLAVSIPDGFIYFGQLTQRRVLQVSRLDGFNP